MGGRPRHASHEAGAYRREPVVAAQQMGQTIPPYG